MKAFVLAAGLGTRLKPWTDHHPKALAPVCGVPMLQRVVELLLRNGVNDITVNVHHFPQQIVDFIKSNGWEINISDETPELLETGGGLLKAYRYLYNDNDPIIVHNVDILSNADLKSLVQYHRISKADVTLLVSDRDSTRKLIFDRNMRLKGWHNVKDGIFRPDSLTPEQGYKELSFSGIYIVSPSVLEYMKSKGWGGRFSIIDFFLDSLTGLNILGLCQENLELIDIGKPETLARAQSFLNEVQ